MIWKILVKLLVFGFGHFISLVYKWSSHIHKTSLNIRASSLFYITHLLYLYHQLFMDIEGENILCGLDCVSFIEILVWNILQWRSEIRPFEIQTFWRSVFKWSGFSYGYSPNHLKTGPFKIQIFLSVFQMVFDKMATICPDLKWLGFQFSDPIPNPDHLQPNLFLPIQNPD